MTNAVKEKNTGEVTILAGQRGRREADELIDFVFSPFIGHL